METKEYLPIFVSESYEYLSLLNNNLVLLEQNPSNRDAMSEVFRAAHTLKGMSATMGYQPLAEAAHRLESMLQPYRDSTRPVEQSIIELGFRVLDYIESQVKRIEAGEEPGPFEMADLGQEEATSAVVESASGLGAYHEAVLKQAVTQGLNAAVIVVQLNPNTLMKSVRAFMVFKVVEDLGFEAIHSEPEAEKLEREEFDDQFKIWVVGNGNLETLKQRMLQIAEVESVVVQPVADSEANPHTLAELDLQHKAANQNTTAKPDAEKAQQGGSKVGTTKSYIRVPAEQVDALMSAISELVLGKAELELAISSGNKELLEETFERISRSIGRAQAEITAMRMTPLSFVFERFPRMVRDLAKELGKEVRFTMQGADTEIDRGIIERLADPLVHLLRNAIDHGIELPEERVKSGKDAVGNLTLAAYHEGNSVYIVVEDDGRGIDLNKVVERAVERGLTTPEQASLLSRDEILSFLFTPGFSTADRVTEVSGRGVGMDVVKKVVEELGGSVQIRSTLGKGTTVTMRLPLTMAIISALLVRVGSEVYALPLSVVEEITDAAKALQKTPQGDLLIIRGEILPVWSLGSVLQATETEGERHFVIVKHGQKKVAIAVNETVGKQEIVIKPLRSRFVPQFVDGATILGDGTVSLVLNISALLEEFRNGR
ncbi:chemotaxis protein CheA [Coprothermobacteraceae bacterium]|nr:chemotaxis protein CheA [Coprothermobacteraceae bacterium]